MRRVTMGTMRARRAAPRGGQGREADPVYCVMEKLRECVINGLRCITNTGCGELSRVIVGREPVIVMQCNDRYP